MKRVVVFGIFDGVHDGHRFLFTKAHEYGEEVIVVVGRDSICEKLKQKTPKYSEKERLSALKQESLVTDAVLGDLELSTYKIVDKLEPHAVCFGYDQEDLEEDFKSWLQKTDKSIEIYRIDSFGPDVYHSSLL